MIMVPDRWNEAHYVEDRNVKRLAEYGDGMLFYTYFWPIILRIILLYLEFYRLF